MRPLCVVVWVGVLNTVVDSRSSRGRQLTNLEKALERDYFMTAAEAVEFGIVDRIVERRAKDEVEETEAKPVEAQESDAPSDK